MNYTLTEILQAADRLQRLCDETVAEWKRLADAGDPDAIALLQAWNDTDQP